MSLPKISHPLFKLVMPSTGKEILFRPFLVSEEKILLMAQQSSSDRDITLAVKQILNNVIQNSDFNIDTLTSFDLDYMFLKLRAKSVNNIVELSYIDTEDEKQYDFKIDLDTIEVKFNEKCNPKISIDENMGLILQYPTIDILANLPTDLNYVDTVERLVLQCISKIYTQDMVYNAKEYSTEELLEFVNNLNIDVYDKIREFFDTLPTVSYKIQYKNSLGNDREVELRTLKDFFTWG